MEYNSAVKKKKKTIDKDYNIDKSPRYHAEWKKPVSKGYTL